ncbi:MAG: hypothetical protein LCH88_20280 [Proteobacteria bacterium]|nr:hypothetical protein [Pseudomonadota bacterium]
MAFNRTRTMLAGLAIAAAAFQAAPAAAQNLNAMNDAFNARMNGAMQSQYQNQYAQLMQNPRFQQMYHQHRAQGGQMSVQQFAYNYMATGGFTEQGMRNYQNSRSQIEDQQRRGMQDMRAAEEARARAQMGYANGYHRNNGEFGRTLQGNSTYTGPNGQNHVLPHTQPGVVQRDAQGRAFVMDNNGQYYQYTPYGWQPMRSGY